MSLMIRHSGVTFWAENEFILKHSLKQAGAQEFKGPRLRRPIWEPYVPEQSRRQCFFCAQARYFEYLDPLNLEPDAPEVDFCTYAA